MFYGSVRRKPQNRIGPSGRWPKEATKLPPPVEAGAGEAAKNAAPAVFRPIGRSITNDTGTLLPVFFWSGAGRAGSSQIRPSGRWPKEATKLPPPVAAEAGEAAKNAAPAVLRPIGRSITNDTGTLLPVFFWSGVGRAGTFQIGPSGRWMKEATKLPPPVEAEAGMATKNAAPAVFRPIGRSISNDTGTLFPVFFWSGAGRAGSSQIRPSGRWPKEATKLLPPVEAEAGEAAKNAAPAVFRPIGRSISNDTGTLFPVFFGPVPAAPGLCKKEVMCRKFLLFP